MSCVYLNLALRDDKYYFKTDQIKTIAFMIYLNYD